MLVRIKQGQSPKKKLIKQIQQADTIEELKSVMLQLLQTSPMGNNSPQGARRGRT